MPKKTKITQADLDTFYDAVKGTKPIPQQKIRLKPSIKVIKPAKPRYNKGSLNLNEIDDVAPVDGESFIEFKQSAIANKILRKLRKGQYNVDAILDLHGMSVEKALTAVDDFLQQCLHEGIRVVLIIHGKGHHSQQPILKNKLNQWLRNLPVVLAFCSAAPTHGNRGAMYVLLKHITEETTLE